MSTRLTLAAVAFSLLVSTVPVRAQVAFTRVPAKAFVAEADENPAPLTYKLVHGVVQGKHGALPGATVWLRGTHTIVVTNSEGQFELRVPTTAQVVELTCGYGGLQEETVYWSPVQALGSIYLLNSKK